METKKFPFMYIFSSFVVRHIDFIIRKTYNKINTILQGVSTMSVRDAGASIREARLKAGLSQEKLSEGICSVLSLSRIENGSAGVSPSTFQALMMHAGAPCEAFPVFANRRDFDCFYTLKRTRFYLDIWQLTTAYEELEKIKQLNFAENKFYYQEWLLLQCRLQFRSGLADHALLHATLLDALHITRPNIDLTDFRDLLLSTNEIELLTSLAQESLYTNNLQVCLAICTQINSYLENLQINFLEKDRLLAENAVVYAKYLIATEDYPTAVTLTQINRDKMVEDAIYAPLHELTFLTGLAEYHQGNTDNALLCFKMAFFSAHSIESCYATICRNYLTDKLSLTIPAEMASPSNISLVPFKIKTVIDSSGFSDGTYDLFSPDALTIGTLIRELRIEQNISQQLLCQGLCSKSKLSKIENGSLQPDTALAQSLLQRLGISDSVFTFYGSTHEAKLQKMRQELTTIPLTNTDEILSRTQEMLHFCLPKDSFYIQYASYRQAYCIPNCIERTAALLDVLCLSLGKFDFNMLSSYRLSWLELTILNNYCSSYCMHSPVKGILTLYKFFEFYNASTMDILIKKRAFAVTLSTLSQHLYNQKRYVELLELASVFSSAAIKCSIYLSGIIFTNYSQALGEMQQFDLAARYAYYSYYNSLITDSQQAANLIKRVMYEDFQIQLL